MSKTDADYWTEYHSDPTHFTRKLSNAPAYSRGAGHFGVSDVDLLREILDPQGDGYAGVVVRDSTGMIVGLCNECNQDHFWVRKSRIEHLLATYCPTTGVGLEALRLALAHYGVRRDLPDLPDRPTKQQ